MTGSRFDPYRDNPDGPAHSYDIGEFRIPGSDTKGHYDRVFCRVMPGQALQIKNVLKSKRFPYRTEGDLERHAIYRHLAWLDTLEVLPSVTRQVDAMIEVLNQEEFQQDFIAVFQNVQSVVAQYTATGANGEARRVLATIINHVDGMPEGYWKARYRHELEEKFGHLMNQGETMRLVERERARGEERA